MRQARSESSAQVDLAGDQLHCLSVNRSWLAVPGVMIFLSLPVCRWLNIGLGAFYTLIMVLTMPGAWWFYITLGVIEVVLSLMIVTHAWRWPKN